MTEVRQRAVAEAGNSKENLDSASNTVGENLVHTASITKEIKNDSPEEKKKVGAGDDDDDGDEMIVVPDFAAAESMHKGSDLTSDVIDATLKDVSPRWRNWIIRGIFTWVMIFAFGGVIYLGPLCIVLLLLHNVFRWRNWIVRTVFTMMMIASFSFVVYLGSVALVLLILIIQIKCFHEIITIGYVVYRSHNLPWFRTLSWFFLFASNYFFYGESIIQYFGVFMSRTEFLNLLVVYHRFISFSLYVAALCGFVMSLVKKNYLKQFIMFGWTHVTLLIIVTQSHLFMQNVFEGIIWFLVPVSMIICNDIMAYIFGFFFGRTPLIKLSPKKTWEGFIGGAISTVVFGVVISYILVQFDFFVCPVEYDEAKGALSTECIRTPEFRPTDFALPMFIQKIGSLFGQNLKTVKMYPFVLHSVSLSVFASVIGPFGGFFASGFKRAFRIKDFGDTIPGHGGFMDRFDCQCLMATFVHVYHSSFIKLVSPQKLVQQITALKPEQQLQVFTMLQEVLLKRGLIDSTTQLPIELPLVNE